MGIVVEAQQVPSGRLRPIAEGARLGAGHLGLEAAEPGEAGRSGLCGRLDQVGEFLARAAVMTGPVELAGKGSVGHCLLCRLSFLLPSYIQQRCPRVQRF